MRKFTALTLLLLFLFLPAYAQKRRTARSKASAPAARASEIGKTAVVVDEKLSILRVGPSLFAEPVHRIQRGRTVRIQDVKEADGVRFYKVTVPPKYYGWVQADAVFFSSRTADETRLANLVVASTGFEKIEIARQFLELYPKAEVRPGILLLYGDLIEEAALKLSKDANSRLKRAELAATGAPLHSYFLNFNMLDRYRKEGIIFLFDPKAKAFHYDGAAWSEIVQSFPKSTEAAEAKHRLESLAAKMGTAGAN